ncbi:META domain-containing protein [Novosphingobium sp. 9U]|uniref:META domain-containing protein n=1 Tax=Novosphingobium sp. 9U TaxID=2653158 RepID=UPI00135AD8A6
MLTRLLALGIATPLAQLPAQAARHVGGRSNDQISGSTWEVVSVGNQPAPRRSKAPAATLLMGGDGAIAGTWECNGGSSAYVRWTKAGGFMGTGGPIIFTAMGCSERDRTDFAGSFWRLMGKAQRWERSGKLLTIRASDGSVARLRLISQRH